MTRRRDHMDPEGTIALLSKLLRGTPWLPDAAWRRYPEVFSSEDPADVDDCLETCRRCPELVPCREWADRCKGSQLTGVVGGKMHATTSTEPTGRKAGRPRKVSA
jgi:hypothetical protein